MRDLQAVMDYFAEARVFGIRPGLDRIEALLEKLGHPESRYPVIHVAGTNGKGSVTAFLAAIAAQTGRRTGWYTSPYLEHFNERIRLIDGQAGFEAFLAQPRSAEISDEQLIDVASTVREAAEAIQADGHEAPTEFELITASAFLFYAQENCDLVILETGMGGRLDATNVVTQPLASIITALGYDHQDRLGTHLAEIAAEKAGIMKAGCPVIVLDPRIALDTRGEAESALELLRSVAKAKNCPYTEIHESMIERLPRPAGQMTQKFYFNGQRQAYEIALLADHQVYNAALAITAAELFASESEIRAGLKLAQWPGRFEFLRRQPPVIIDGAHNLQGVLALRAELERYFSGQELIFMTGILADKEHEAMLTALFANASFKTRAVFVTEPPVPRAFGAQALAEELARHLQGAELIPYSGREELMSGAPDTPTIYYERDYRRLAEDLPRLAEAWQLPLIAFGSLYLIGNSRPQLREAVAQ